GAFDAGGLLAQIREQPVVLLEVTGRGLTNPQLALQTVGGLLGDVLVQGARRMPRLEDAQDSLVIESSEASGVRESGVDVLGGEALAQQQDASCDAAPVARRSGTEQAEELRRILTHLLEGRAELVEVDGWAAGVA